MDIKKHDDGWLKNLQLTGDMQMARRDTRLNGQRLGVETEGCWVGVGRWDVGVELKRIPENDSFSFKTWTIESGLHTVSFHGVVTRDGQVLGGRVNWFPLDQPYFDELLKEFSINPPKWDLISYLARLLDH